MSKKRMPQMYVNNVVVGKVLIPSSMTEALNWNMLYEGQMTKAQKDAIFIYQIVLYDGWMVYGNHYNEEEAVNLTASHFGISPITVKMLLNKYRFKKKPYFKV